MSLKLSVLVIILSFSAILQTSLCIHEECMIRATREHGICKYMSDCIQEVSEMTRVEDYTICGYQQRKKIVCCPILTRTTNESNGTSANMCTEYSSQCDSEHHTALIVGGRPANPKEFPHMASLGIINGTGYITIICGGSLISNQFVLTSANCTKGMEKEAQHILILGDLDYNTEIDDATPEIYQFTSFYQNEEETNNLALVKLHRKVQFSDYIRPACLPSTFEVHRTDLIVTSWGDNYNSRRNITVLQKSVLEILSDNACKNIYNSKYNQVIDETHFFCASFSGTNICHGDTGGPVQAYHPRYSCMYTIIGISNIGIHHSCDNDVPSIYTRVFPHLNWIEKIVWNTNNY